METPANDRTATVTVTARAERVTGAEMAMEVVPVTEMAMEAELEREMEQAVETEAEAAEEPAAAMQPMTMSAYQIRRVTMRL